MIRNIKIGTALGAMLLFLPLAALAAEADIEGFEFECRFSDGTVLKPKFGDIEGVFYTDLPAQREQCLDAIKRKIALCEQNIDFKSNTTNHEYPECLPEFRKQAKACIGHFHFERGKCDAGGPQQVDQTEQEAEEPDYVVEAVEREMELAKQANVRSGPGTDYEVVATLDTGIGVRVTGEVQGLDWLRVDVLEGGGEAFIYAPLLKMREAESETPLEPFGPRWFIVENQPCQFNLPRGYGNVRRVFTWDGACVDGKITGNGRLVEKTDNASYWYEGGMREGKFHGHWVVSDSSGDPFRAADFQDGKEHRRYIFHRDSGEISTCEVRNDKLVEGSCTLN